VVSDVFAGGRTINRDIDKDLGSSVFVQDQAVEPDTYLSSPAGWSDQTDQSNTRYRKNAISSNTKDHF
jgi:hypothetical protein